MTTKRPARKAYGRIPESRKAMSISDWRREAATAKA